MRKNLAVYSCVTGGFDLVQEPPKIEGIDFILFTDRSYYTSNGWRIEKINKSGYDNLTANRNVKINIPQIIKNQYSSSLYIDGNVLLKPPIIQKVLQLNAEGVTIAVNRHPRYDCIYQDILEVCRVGLIDADVGLKWAKRAFSLGIKKIDGYYECNIIFRRHCNHTEILMTKWWKEFKDKYRRDQPAFRIVLAKNLRYAVVDLALGNVRSTENQYAYVEHHLIKKPKINRLLVRLRSILTGNEYQLRRFISVNRLK
jgi:hypothetical protein